jgi:hypothetical protein
MPIVRASKPVFAERIHAIVEETGLGIPERARGDAELRSVGLGAVVVEAAVRGEAWHVDPQKPFHAVRVNGIGLEGERIQTGQPGQVAVTLTN